MAYVLIVLLSSRLNVMQVGTFTELCHDSRVNALKFCEGVHSAMLLTQETSASVSRFE